MSAEDLKEDDELTAQTDADLDADAEGDAAEEERIPLNLDVKIDRPGACQRHITVTVPREDVERYFDKAFKELMPSANVPGFRAGRAPRKLVEHRFRKDVADQVKGSLLMDSLSQVTEDQKLAAISEPDFDPTAVELPDEGPMTFEFDLEVRPEFDLPKWQGLTIERPTRDYSPADVDQELKRVMASRTRLTPFEGPAQAGDFVTATISFKDGDTTLSEAMERTIRLGATLNLRDGRVDNFAQAMAGVEAGQTKTLTVEMSDAAANEHVRGKPIQAEFHVLEVKKLNLPELTPELLKEWGDFDSEGDLRDVVKQNLQRQLVYHQQQRVRQQVTALLTAAADWELPPEMLRRQSKRELERAKLEWRRSGFADEEIVALENRLRQSSMDNTARALKEHFILERIAEEENIEDSPEDYDHEIRLIADQSGESVRRVRAKLERQDLMDVLRNQIIENKTIELILSKASFKDAPFVPQKSDVESLDLSAGGEEEEETEIPEAKHAGEAKPLRGMDQRA